jgi:hypothetical protein
VRRARGDKPLGQYVKGLQASEQGRLEAVYRSLVLEDDAVARGVANGSISVDTRLRDALGGGASSDVRESRFARDDAALRDADVVRLVRRLDVLRDRLEDVERRPWARS